MVKITMALLQWKAW